jgi:tetratricopeptide (TPR) repeat protein
MDVIECCPQCHSVKLFPAEDNQYRCGSCGWQGHELFQLKRESTWSKLFRWSFLSSLILFMLLMTYQFTVWRQHSFEATYLLMRKAMGTLPEEEAYRQLGSLCNGLENYPCSLSYFQRIVDRNPRDKSALANLAISLGHMGRWREAKSHLNAYFSLGGGAYDAVYWYGKSVAKVESPEKGLEWLYYSLQLNQTENSEAVRELCSELREMGRFYEALSLIGGYLSGVYHKNRFWHQMVDGLLREAKKQSGPHGVVDLPGISHQLYYMPVTLREDGRVQYFVVNPNAERVSLSFDQLDENSILVPADAKEIELKSLNGVKTAKKFSIDLFRMGPWSFKNVEVVVCATCAPTIGKSLLKKFDVTTVRKHRTEFLSLSLQGEGG